ncbi:MAG: hypothetical protein RSF34_18980 [Flavobacterium sp.]|uniref:hypothetical protein n=1 Tax=Flavobacterium sp. TaxID=239 RepID=UPI002FCACA4A
MTKKGFLAGLFLLGISVTAFAKSNETVKRESVVNGISINNNILEGIESVDQSGGGSNGGTVLIPIKPPKPPVILY